MILVGRKYQISLLLQTIDHYFNNNHDLKILDFGCGDGTISKIVLSRFKNAHIDLLDGSQVMVEKLKSSFNEKNVNILYTCFSEWINQNDNEYKYDLIFSSMAIHHLEHFQKYELYSKIYTALKYKGIFVNIDIVKPINASVETLQFNMWKNCIFKELSTQNKADEFKNHENITDVYKNNQENKPSTLNSQITMLENIGFVDVDCHYKNGAFAMFSGQKC